MTWLEIHGERPEVLAHWRALEAEPRPGTPLPDGNAAGIPLPVAPTGAVAAAAARSPSAAPRRVDALRHRPAGVE